MGKYKNSPREENNAIWLDLKVHALIDLIGRLWAYGKLDFRQWLLKKSEKGIDAVNNTLDFRSQLLL